jgi:hypothetical protein
MSEYAVQEGSYNDAGPASEPSTVCGHSPDIALGQGEHGDGKRVVLVGAGVSPEQRAANQANALHSTGPRTQAGKDRASRNAVTHGLQGRFQLIVGEAAIVGHLCKITERTQFRQKDASTAVPRAIAQDAAAANF